MATYVDQKFTGALGTLPPGWAIEVGNAEIAIAPAGGPTTQALRMECPTHPLVDQGGYWETVDWEKRSEVFITVTMSTPTWAEFNFWAYHELPPTGLNPDDHDTDAYGRFRATRQDTGTTQSRSTGKPPFIGAWMQHTINLAPTDQPVRIDWESHWYGGWWLASEPPPEIYNGGNVYIADLQIKTPPVKVRDADWHLNTGTTPFVWVKEWSQWYIGDQQTIWPSYYYLSTRKSIEILEIDTGGFGSLPYDHSRMTATWDKSRTGQGAPSGTAGGLSGSGGGTNSGRQADSATMAWAYVEGNKIGNFLQSTSHALYTGVTYSSGWGTIYQYYRAASAQHIMCYNFLLIRTNWHADYNWLLSGKGIIIGNGPGKAAPIPLALRDPAPANGAYRSPDHLKYISYGEYVEVPNTLLSIWGLSTGIVTDTVDDAELDDVPLPGVHAYVFDEAPGAIPPYGGDSTLKALPWKPDAEWPTPRRTFPDGTGGDAIPVSMDDLLEGEILWVGKRNTYETQAYDDTWKTPVDNPLHAHGRRSPAFAGDFLAELLLRPWRHWIEYETDIPVGGEVLATHFKIENSDGTATDEPLLLMNQYRNPYHIIAYYEDESGNLIPINLKDITGSPWFGNTRFTQ